MLSNRNQSLGSLFRLAIGDATAIKLAGWLRTTLSSAAACRSSVHCAGELAWRRPDAAAYVQAGRGAAASLRRRWVSRGTPGVKRTIGAFGKAMWTLADNIGNKKALERLILKGFSVVNRDIGNAELRRELGSTAWSRPAA